MNGAHKVAEVSVYTNCHAVGYMKTLCFLAWLKTQPAYGGTPKWWIGHAPICLLYLPIFHLIPITLATEKVHVHIQQPLHNDKTCMTSCGIREGKSRSRTHICTSTPIAVTMHGFHYTAAHQVFEKPPDMAWQRTGHQALAVALLHLLSDVQDTWTTSGKHMRQMHNLKLQSMWPHPCSWINDITYVYMKLSPNLPRYVFTI